MAAHRVLGHFDAGNDVVCEIKISVRVPYLVRKFQIWLGQCAFIIVYSIVFAVMSIFQLAQKMKAALTDLIVIYLLMETEAVMTQFV